MSSNIGRPLKEPQTTAP